MQRILIGGFPFILIDESQDTHKVLVDALFELQRAHPDEVVLGFFGDMMQRIYADGKEALGDDLPSSWAKPTKMLNWRCPRRVISLINKVRAAFDPHVQQPWSGAPEGWARMFVLPADAPDKQSSEAAVASRMALLTGDAQWEAPDGYKALFLEHHMAARRMGFDKMFEALHSFTSFRTGLLNGTLSIVTPFSHRVLPLVEANGDRFEIARIVQAHSLLLSAEALRQSTDQSKLLTSAQDAVASLLGVVQQGAGTTFKDVLRNIVESGLFGVPDDLRAAASRDEETDDPGAADEKSERAQAIDKFLATPFEQIEPYVRYVSGAAGFATHQEVKGLEFPRVMVVMDDTEARGFMFKYEKLFGSAAREDSVTSSTRRLFYVTCSRAQQGLALVAYTNDPERVRGHVLQNGWFEDGEVVIGQ